MRYTGQVIKDSLRYAREHPISTFILLGGVLMSLCACGSNENAASKNSPKEDQSSYFTSTPVYAYTPTAAALIETATKLPPVSKTPKPAPTKPTTPTAQPLGNGTPVEVNGNRGTKITEMPATPLSTGIRNKDLGMNHELLNGKYTITVENNKVVVKPIDENCENKPLKEIKPGQELLFLDLRQIEKDTEIIYGVSKGKIAKISADGKYIVVQVNDNNVTKTILYTNYSNIAEINDGKTGEYILNTTSAYTTPDGIRIETDKNFEKYIGTINFIKKNGTIYFLACEPTEYNFEIKKGVSLVQKAIIIPE